MLNTVLSQWSGEVYRLGVGDGELTVTIRRALYNHLLERLSRGESERRFLEMRTALHTDVVKFEFGLPFISFPNRSHKKIDWDMLSKRAEQVVLLLRLLNFSKISGENYQSDLYLSERPQLMAIATGCNGGGGFPFPNFPIEVGFHQSAVDTLVKVCKSDMGDMVVPGAERRIFEFYSGMSLATMKERVRRENTLRKYGSSSVGICAKVRAGGIPHFTVPGNCACLGANPDEFRDSAELYSHNMDSPLQQISMLAGLASFWNDFLLPAWWARQREG